MSYLARLKQLDDDKFSHSTPDIDLPKPPKPPFDSFGSTDTGLYAKKISANDNQPKAGPVVVAIAYKPEPRPDRNEWRPDPCNRCAHMSRFTGGNACRTDNGLQHLFGMLYTVPDDGGAACKSWQVHRLELLSLRYGQATH